ncbi:MAG: hypothetical protein LBQ08_03450 [Holosporaceae bacterium]|jgi:hypothetical protein|nr:hypothetical protein [Holosporaceae bacterium]
MNKVKSLSLLLSFLYFSVFSMENLRTPLNDDNNEFRTRMYRAACTTPDENKLRPYQNRETLIKILEETGHPISRKVGLMSIIRTCFVFSEAVMNIAPIVTGALSFYYGKKGEDTSGVVSMFSTIVILPMRKFFSEAILWSEDKHRDYLLQSLDYLVAKIYGNLGTREMLINQILNEIREPHATAGLPSMTETEPIAVVVPQQQSP